MFNASNIEIFMIKFHFLFINIFILKEHSNLGVILQISFLYTKKNKNFFVIKCSICDNKFFNTSLFLLNFDVPFLHNLPLTKILNPPLLTTYAQVCDFQLYIVLVIYLTELFKYY